MDLKRIFTSIDLPDQIRGQLRYLQRPEIRPVKWMKPDNFHITLNFLGEMNDQQIQEAVAILNDLSNQTERFALTLANFKAERDMLWLMPATYTKLFDLQDQLKVRFEDVKLGKRERRGYSPHILFAKTKTGRRFEWQMDNFQPLAYTVDRINLYESRLTPEAATHILIKSFPLREESKI